MSEDLGVYRMRCLTLEHNSIKVTMAREELYKLVLLAGRLPKRTVRVASVVKHTLHFSVQYKWGCPLALNFRGDVTRIPNQGHPYPKNRTCVRQK